MNWSTMMITSMNVSNIKDSEGCSCIKNVSRETLESVFSITTEFFTEDQFLEYAFQYLELYEDCMTDTYPKVSETFLLE